MLLDDELSTLAAGRISVQCLSSVFRPGEFNRNGSFMILTVRLTANGTKQSEMSEVASSRRVRSVPLSEKSLRNQVTVLHVNL